MKETLARISPDERNRLLFLENKAKILSVFSKACTFSEALKNLKISQTTLDKHIKNMLEEGLLEHKERNYNATTAGMTELNDLKNQVEKLRALWKHKKNPNLFRYTIRQANGNVGKVQYSGFMEVWRSPETEIPQAALDQVFQTLANSLTRKGLGTLKCSMTIDFRDASI